MLNLFTISHFSSTACSETMAKRHQQESGKERFTAKSRPVMNLTARMPTVVSSSTSSSPLAVVTGQPSLAFIVDDCECDSENLSKGACLSSSPPVVMRSFISWSSPTISSRVRWDAGGRGTSWSMSSRAPGTLQSLLVPWGSRGDGNVASSLCASLLPAQRRQSGRWCTLLSVPHQVPAVPNVKRKVFGILKCHRDNTASCESRFRQKKAREGVAPRVMVTWRHFQATRPNVSRW